MEKLCEHCGNCLGKGGDVYFLPSEQANITKVSSYVVHDWEKGVYSMHFETEIKCGNCQTVILHEVSYPLG